MIFNFIKIKFKTKMKKQKSKLTWLFLGLMATGIFSCSKDVQNPLIEKEKSGEVVAGAYTQLGRKLENPYSVKNMRKAAALLTRKRNVEMPPTMSQTLNQRRLRLLICI